MSPISTTDSESGSPASSLTSTPGLVHPISRRQRSTASLKPHVEHTGGSSQRLREGSRKSGKAPMEGRPRAMTIGRKAQLQLEFVIIGGGIGGLAAAHALAQAGHRVRVLEKSSGLSQNAGGVRVPPNLTKILFEWGLEDEVKKLSMPCRGSTFQLMETGDIVGYMGWKEDVLKMTGADFFLMHYEDLHRILYRLAVSEGAEVNFDAKVVAVQPPIDGAKEFKPVVLLESGEHISADFVIGADGPTSIIRELVTEVDDVLQPTGMSFYTANIPSEAMKKDPSLADYPDKPEWPMWMGNSRSVLGYPVRGGKEFTVHIYWPDEEVSEQTEEESWDVLCPAGFFNLESYDPKLHRLTKMAPYWIRSKYVQRQHAGDWVDSSGRILLTGEAAHPLMPCTMHGPSLAVEDAVVLGEFFSHVRAMDQLPLLCDAFQDLRQERCHTVAQSEYVNAMTVTLPPGPQRHGRDEMLKQTLASADDARQWDDSELRGQWEQISEVFGYSAREHAEDWWVNWGMLREHSKAATMEPLVFASAVKTEVKQETSVSP